MLNAKIFCFVLKMLLESPVLRAIVVGQQVHTLPICKFEGLVGWLDGPNFDIGESHQLIPKSIEPGIPSVIPSVIPSSVGICSRN